ncbi:MAG: MFS transporter [Bacteroidales bacterium]|nr:MFS transporter [Bacteroidales bacterium]
MIHKPKLSFWQIWNMSFGFLGIQFGFALQNANVSRIFETLGADASQIPVLWLAAPVTGLIVQPIIGYYSDRTWCRLGRRRPFFLAGAILATLGLMIMPNSPALWVAAGMLWMLDASINISMEPFRALVGDMLPSEQRTEGFAMQSFFIGTGAVVASILPYVLTNFLNIPNTAPIGEIPLSVKYSFYMGASVFFLAVLWTVIKTKEYSPEQLASFSLHENEYENTSKGHLLKNLFVDFAAMPHTMIQLASVQFFSWFALFSMWIYATPAITAHVYGASDTGSILYNEGANWVGVLFAVYNGVAAIVAFGLSPLAKITSRKKVHSFSLVLGGIGLMSIYFIKSPEILILSMIGVGIAWASILSMPYAILAGSLPVKKMGFYMGVFNFFIVIPQIFAASTWGYLVKHLFNNQSVYALVAGGASFIVAALLVFVVRDVDDKKNLK